MQQRPPPLKRYFPVVGAAEEAQPSSFSWMEVLPNELLEHFFCWLAGSISTLARCSLVCSRWHGLIDTSPELWWSVVAAVERQRDVLSLDLRLYREKRRKRERQSRGDGERKGGGGGGRMMTERRRHKEVRFVRQSLRTLVTSRPRFGRNLEVAIFAKAAERYRIILARSLLDLPRSAIFSSSSSAFSSMSYVFARSKTDGLRIQEVAIWRYVAYKDLIYRVNFTAIRPSYSITSQQLCSCLFLFHSSSSPCYSSSSTPTTSANSNWTIASSATATNAPATTSAIKTIGPREELQWVKRHSADSSSMRVLLHRSGCFLVRLKEDKPELESESRSLLLFRKAHLLRNRDKEQKQVESNGLNPSQDEEEEEEEVEEEDGDSTPLLQSKERQTRETVAGYQGSKNHQNNTDEVSSKDEHDDLKQEIEEVMASIPWCEGCLEVACYDDSNEESQEGEENQMEDDSLLSEVMEEHSNNKKRIAQPAQLLALIIESAKARNNGSFQAEQLAKDIAIDIPPQLEQQEDEDAEAQERFSLFPSNDPLQKAEMETLDNRVAERRCRERQQGGWWVAFLHCIQGAAAMAVAPFVFVMILLAAVLGVLTGVPSCIVLELRKSNYLGLDKIPIIIGLFFLHLLMVIIGTVGITISFPVILIGWMVFCYRAAFQYGLLMALWLSLRFVVSIFLSIWRLFSLAELR